MLEVLLYHLSVLSSDLVSGGRYTVSVSTFSDLSDQVEEAGQFSTIASTQEVTVLGGTSNNTAIAVGVSIAVVIVFIIIATVLVVLFLVW